MDESNEVHEVLIGLPNLKGNHSGPNIAALAFKVIEEYAIGPKVGFYMLDSATNNDTMIVELHNLLIANYGWESPPNLI